MVRVEGLRRGFPGTGPVLDDVGFSVAPGSFVAVLGPSGSGKSTLLNIIAGIDTPDAGSVTIAGEPVRPGTPHAAYMPQADLLFPWRSVLANTALGLEVAGVDRTTARRRAGELFAEFGLAGTETSRPHELSGGMRQRAALLRTVVQERPLLLLDEPFGALDSITRGRMQAWLGELWNARRWTTLMVTHDVREAVMLADRVLVFSARPARVVADIAVPLPRPRDESSALDPAFTQLEARLLAALRDAATPPH